MIEAMELFGGFNGAVLDDERDYRYALWRIWDWSNGYAMFIGLNPSTADETVNDPTIRRCHRFALDWGYGGLVMCNLFAWRATKPRVMQRADEPIGPDNDAWLAFLAQGAEIVIAAWGVKGGFMERDREVCELGFQLYCLDLTREGAPRHPLYAPANLRPTRFWPR